MKNFENVKKSIFSGILSVDEFNESIYQMEVMNIINIFTIRT